MLDLSVRRARTISPGPSLDGAKGDEGAMERTGGAEASSGERQVDRFEGDEGEQKGLLTKLLFAQPWS